jgi:heptosyltransferase-2
VKKILIIQTAFIGDVVLATALVEKLGMNYKESNIDFVVRKGNEQLLANNPFIRNVLVWNKKKDKIRNLFKLVSVVRKNRYDVVINLQRYLSTGILAIFSGSKKTIGFNKNPLSFLYTKKIIHQFDIKNPRHEVERNNDLIKDLTDESVSRPALYPSQADEQIVTKYKTLLFVTMTPSSVWFTKKYPVEKWIDLINHFNPAYKIYLLGGALWWKE